MNKIWIAFIPIMIILSTVSCAKTLNKPNPTVGTVVKEATTVIAYGTVKALTIENLNVGFQASIEKVYVKEGEMIKKGDKLIDMDTSAYTDGLNKLNNQLNKLNYESNKNNNDLAYAQKVYNGASTDLAKEETLFKAGGVSQQDLDALQRKVDADKKAVDDAQYAVDSAQYAINDAQSAIDVTLAEKQPLNNIEGNTIVSDIQNGVVYNINCKKGDIINPMSSQNQTLLSIIDFDSRVVEADVVEEFMKDVKLGASVDISPQADKSKVFKGKITRMSNMMIQKNGETDRLVDITIDDKDNFLLPGMNVDILINK